MRLCFGTFASILCSGKGHGVTNTKFVGTMTRTVDPTCEYINNTPRVSKLLSCEENLSDGLRKRQIKGKSELPLSSVISKAEIANKEAVARSFDAKVVPLIINDKKRQVILALRDLIRDDTTLDAENKESFKKHLGRSKDDLIKLCELEDITLVLSTMLSEILAGIFLYTVIEVENVVGKGCKSLINEYIKKYSNNSNELSAKERVESLPTIRNIYFTGRSALLKQIQHRFAVSNADTHTTQVIYGLDGMGKTQLALEYAHNALVSRKGKYDTICWIDCSTEDAVKKSCRYFLSKIGETETLDAVSRLTHWLQLNSKWLLILDDVNDDAIVERLIPKTGKGHILATAQQGKHFLTKESIRLECMKKEEAVDFLIKRTNIDDRISAELIAERLGCLPLALEQSAAYICGSEINFSKFLELINKYELTLFESKYSIGSHERTIHTVWNITLDKLRENSKRLLYCFAYMSADSIELNWLTEYAQNLKKEQEKPDVFAPQRGNNGYTGKQINISEILKKFAIQSKFPPGLIAVLADELALIVALSELKEYSLITSKKDYSFAMHILLQEVIRNSITTPSYILSVWEVLQARFSYTDLIYDNYRIAFPLPQAEPLIRNIQAFLEYREELEKYQNKDKLYKTWVDMADLEFQLYSFTAQYLTLRGDAEGDDHIYEVADKYYSKACELAQLLFGGGENDTVSNTGSFTTIQEKHRRMRVNLLLKRNDVAYKLYEEAKKVLINSIPSNPGMVGNAFTNYAKLWCEFGFSDISGEARELAAKCGVARFKK